MVNEIVDRIVGLRFEEEICYYFIKVYFSLGELVFGWYIFNCVVNVVFVIIVVVFNMVILIVIWRILVFYILFGVFFFGLGLFDFGVGFIVYLFFFC